MNDFITQRREEMWISLIGGRMWRSLKLFCTSLVLSVMGSGIFMLPYFMRYDHHNYAKGGTIYLADMMQLPKPVLDEFSQVDVDHGQEWLIRAGKTGGGIVGITKTNSTLGRWALSYNLRSSIVIAAQTMYGQSNQESLMHDESKHGRQQKDNEAEDAMLSTLLQFHVMLKDVHPQRLHTICTKDLATNAIQEALLHAKAPGGKHVTEFVKERLLIEDGKVTVPFKTVPRRNKPQTLESLYDIAKDKTQNERKVVWKADRDVMQRLITSYEGVRNVNIQNVMRHELMPVPISIAETDGSLRTCTKSTLAALLTNPFVSPQTIVVLLVSSCILIDGMALVCT